MLNINLLLLCCPCFLSGMFANFCVGGFWMDGNRVYNTCANAFCTSQLFARVLLWCKLLLMRLTHAAHTDAPSL